MSPRIDELRRAGKRLFARVPSWTPDLLAFAVMVALGYVYLLPVSVDLFQNNNESRMIGDQSDLIGLSWEYRIIVHTLLHDPARFVYGAIYTETLNAPSGAPLWIPWIERLVVPLLTPITNDATLPTAVAWLLMSLNGLFLYIFGRMMRWPRLVCLAMGCCLAFNNYTRARANVHTGFVGVFGIVLLFIAMELVSSREWMAPDKRKRSLTWATLALFFAMFSPHYYLIIFIICTPFFLVYFLLRTRSAQMPMLLSLGRMVACAVPAVLFLAWNFAMPLSAADKARVAATPEVRTENVEFLHAFGAHPSDYLGFDLKLGSKDWIKERAEITEQVRAEIGGSNDHERSNGIRWSLLAMFAAATVVQLWPTRSGRRAELRSSQFRGLLIVFAFICFFCSLSPQGLKSYDTEFAPSLYIFKYFPNFRVPSRFGVFAQFGVIVVVAEFWVAICRRWFLFGEAAKWLLNPILPIVMFIDYAPMNPVKIAPFAYQRKELLPATGECGMGMSMPYSHWGTAIFQQTRGTNCNVIFPVEKESERLLESTFSDRLNYDVPANQERFVAFARCTGADWVVMGGQVSPAAKAAICGSLGWPFVANDSCRAPGINPRKKKAIECLR